MKKLLSPWFALLTLVLLISIRLLDPTFVESVRLRYFDTLISSKEAMISTQTHVVNIDDEYIRQKGQFPFPRGEYGDIIAELYNRNAGLVVLNIYMPDADRFGQDSQLAEVLKKYNVVLPHSTTSDNIINKYPPFRPGVSIVGGDTAGVNYGTIEPNVRQINATAAGIGVVNTFPEIDGVTRRVPMVVQSDGQVYPSISMETLRVAANERSFQVKVNELGVEAVRIPQFSKITTDSLSRIWIDWSIRPDEHSLSSLPPDFREGIVIVGVTGKGINNPVGSSIGPVYPHYVQAAVLDTITSGSSISRPDWATGVEIIFTILAVVLSLYLTRYTHGYLFAVAIAATVYFGGVQVFLRSSYLLDAVFPIIAILVCSFHGYIIKFLSELRQKLQIKKQFGTYLSPAMVEKLQNNPELLQLGGESRELSIMFTDVRGFTTISEHYGKDVQGLTKIMNRYMTAMTAKIIENNGTLDKYIGDAQMAFWNAPLDEPRHAKMAVKTALQMLGSLDEFNKEISSEGIPAFGMGLGINTDVVVVGNMGSSQRFDYTCLGDGVNLASRLEGQSKPYGVKIVLGPKTAEQVKDTYPVVELDCIAVKGKKDGVKIYTIANTNYEIHDTFLGEYYIGEWGRAIILLKDLIEESTELDQYYKNMLVRLEEGVPAYWDGTYRATSK